MDEEFARAITFRESQYKAGFADLMAHDCSGFLSWLMRETGIWDDRKNCDGLWALCVVVARNELIAGDFSPSGRLPLTFYRSTEDLLQGVIIKGNAAPMEAAANMADGILFRFWVTHTIETSFIFVRKQTPRIPAGVTIRAATAADVPQMQAFQDREAPRRHGYPVYDFQKLMAGDPYYTGLRITDYALAWRGDTLIGMLAGWDQKAYKQTRVMGFKPVIQALRPLYNLYVGMVGGFKLPPIGGALNYLTLYNVLIADDDPAIFQALIDWVMAHQGQRYDALATAVTHGDPLETVPRGYKRQKLLSENLWMSYGEDPRPGMDARPLYAELGRL